MNLKINFATVSTLLAGLASIIAAALGYVPAEYSESVAMFGTFLGGLSVQFGKDDDGDGMPNIIDGTPQG